METKDFAPNKPIGKTITAAALSVAMVCSNVPGAAFAAQKTPSKTPDTNEGASHVENGAVAPETRDEAAQRVAKAQEEVKKAEGYLKDSEGKKAEAQLSFDQAKASYDAADKEAKQAEEKAALAFEKQMDDARELVVAKKGESQKASQDLKEAQDKKTQAAKDLGQVNQKLKEAQDAYDKAVEAAGKDSVEQLEAAKKDLADAQEKLNEAKANKQNAEKDLAQVKKTFEEAKATLASAQLALTQAQETLDGAQKDFDTKDEEFKAAEKAYQQSISQDVKDKIDEAKTKLDEAQEARNKAASVLEQNKQAKTDVDSQVKALETELLNKKKELDDAKAEAKLAEDKVAEEEGKQVQAKAAVDKAQADLEKQDLLIDDIKANQNLAKDEVKKAKEALDEAKAEKLQAQAKVDKAKAQLDEALEKDAESKKELQEQLDTAKIFQELPALGLIDELAGAGYTVDANIAYAANDENTTGVCSTKELINKFEKENGEHSFLVFVMQSCDEDRFNKAMDAIDYCNNIRKDNGLKPLMVDSRLMASAVVASCLSEINWNHNYWGPVANGENLASDTTVEGLYKMWYYSEKEVYENYLAQGLTPNQIESEHYLEVGHYLNIIGDSSSTGFGSNGYTATQQFAGNDFENLKTTDEMREALVDYKKSIADEVARLEGEMGKDSQEVTQAKASLKKAEDLFNAAATKVDQKQANLQAKEESQNKIDAQLGNALSDKDLLTQDLADAQDTLNLAEQHLAQAEDAKLQKDAKVDSIALSVDETQDSLNVANTKAHDAQIALDDAKDDLEAKDAQVKSAQADLDALTQDSSELKHERDIKKQARDEALELLNEAEGQKTEAQEKLDKAQEEYRQAETNLGTSTETLSQAGKEVDKAEKHLSLVKDKVEAIQARLAGVVEAEENLNQAKDEVGKAKSNLEEAEGKVLELEEKVGQAQKELKEAEKQAQEAQALLESYKGVDTPKTSHADLDEMIGALKDKLGKVEQLQQKLDSAQEKLDSAKDEQKTAQAAYDDAVATLVQEQLYLDSFTLKFIKGANQTGIIGSEILFEADGDYTKLKAVLIDGNILDAENYQAYAGSTIIVLKPSYTASLKADTSYELELQYTDGSFAKTKFSVKTQTNNPGKTHEKPGKTGGHSAKHMATPETGDVASLASSLFGLGLVSAYISRRRAKHLK